MMCISRSGFDPQALTSLTRLKRVMAALVISFDPQALTSLTNVVLKDSTYTLGFDPQALTSLTLTNFPENGIFI